MHYLDDQTDVSMFAASCLYMVVPAVSCRHLERRMLQPDVYGWVLPSILSHPNYCPVLSVPQCLFTQRQPVSCVLCVPRERHRRRRRVGSIESVVCQVRPPPPPPPPPLRWSVRMDRARPRPTRLSASVSVQRACPRLMPPPGQPLGAGGRAVRRCRYGRRTGRPARRLAALGG